jgi:hypothetical protein
MYNKQQIMDTMNNIIAESKNIAPYVIIAQPRRIADETPAQLLDASIGLHIDMLGYSHGYVEIAGEKVDVARNYLIERVLESNAKYMLFVGEDTVLPYDGFIKLHETAESNPNTIVSGVYYIKLSSPMVMIKQNDWVVPANVDPGQVYPVHLIGMDAMLIPVEVLRRLKDDEPELPFCCILNDKELGFIGEDNFFLHRVQKLGIEVLVNTDVQCLHIDLATGKYTAHPNINLNNYFTNIPITERLTMNDKKEIDQRWLDRLPGDNNG